MGQSLSSQPQTSDDFRALALAASQQRRTLSTQSQTAWRHGRRAEAKALSELAKAQAVESERLNAEAAGMIFLRLNPGHPSVSPPPARGWFSGWFGKSRQKKEKVGKGLEKVDLHGLFVAEALERVKIHLALCREGGVKRTILITGRGLHSRDGIARIKPAVEEWVRERGEYSVVSAGRNDGVVEVMIVKKRERTTGILAGVWRVLGW